MKKTITLLILSLFAFTGAYAQLNGWAYKVPVTIGSTGSAIPNFQVFLDVDTQTPITAGKMSSLGDDIRFGSACGDTLYDFWIESGINTVATKIWVKIPITPAVGTSTIYMFYGNTAAVNASNFNTTFPLSLVTGGSNVTLNGNLTYDWLQVDAGDTLFLTAGSILTINVTRKAIIEGVVYGKGKGNLSSPINTAGIGPGAGTTSTNSGCGGGSYAGIGGTGGMDAGDSPGTGGPTYGTSIGTDVNMGSSGGSGTGISVGGAGGGAFYLNAEQVVLNGSIVMDGGDALTDGTGRGGGGGSGGCIRVDCETLAGSGTVSVKGGKGGFGTSTANDSGGGGGGGRIKVFYGSSMAILNRAILGGIGGPNGTAAPGQPGTAGTFDSLMTIYPSFPFALAGTEDTINYVSLTPTSFSTCDGNAITIVATPGFASYLWSTAETTDSITVLSGSSYSISASDNGGCVSYDTVVVNFIPLPVVAITAPSYFACQGDSITLTATTGFPTYLWSTGNTDTSIVVSTPANYYVIVTDSTGCTNSDTITFGNYPTSLFGIVAPTLISCVGDSVALTATSGFVNYLWSTGNTDSTIVVASPANYYVTALDSMGCSYTDSVTFSNYLAPAVTITTAGTTLDASSGFANYQWYYNGAILPTSTSQTLDASINGNGLYQVYAVDNNGCTATDSILFNAIGLKSDNAGLELNLFPNPASGKVALHMKHLTDESCLISISDLMGRTLTKYNGTVSHGEMKESISLSGFDSGVYIVHVTFGKISISRKLIVQ